MKKSPASNFLLLLSGITLLFMACLPDLGEFFTAILRKLMRLFDLDSLGLMLILSKVFLILGGGALAALGLVNTIIECQKAGRQPNWVVVACIGGSMLFGFLSLIPVLFWIGILACPALIVALIMSYKEQGHVLRNPLTKPAALLLMCLLAAFTDRWINVSGGMINFNIFGALVGIAAFIGVVMMQARIRSVLDVAGQASLNLLTVGSILYVVAEFFSLLGALVWFLGFVAMPLALAGWILYLIAGIKMMGSQSLNGAAHKAGLFLMIGVLASMLSGLPLANLAAVLLMGYGAYLLAMGIEENA